MSGYARAVKRQGSAQHARAVKQVLGPVHDILARLSEANRTAADPFEKWRRQAVILFCSGGGLCNPVSGYARAVKRQGSAQHARAVKQVLGPVHDILARLSEANRTAADPFEKWRRQAVILFCSGGGLCNPVSGAYGERLSPNSLLLIMWY